MNTSTILGHSDQFSKTTKTSYRPRILILDDDAVVGKIMKSHLELEFPEAEIEVNQRAVVQLGFDVYFLDNDFGGELMALSLLNSVRRVAPQALVVALSNTLDVKVMTELINAGCNAVYNKRDLFGSEAARRIIRSYFDVLSEEQKAQGGFRILSLVRSMRELIDSWNQRLSTNVNIGNHSNSSKTLSIG
jgi:DNA-binding NtrC family response regulator